jgi:hypothetical protein
MFSHIFKVLITVIIENAKIIAAKNIFKKYAEKFYFSKIFFNHQRMGFFLLAMIE